jgi:hypothetical protein
MEGTQRLIVTPRFFKLGVLSYQIDDVDPCLDVISDGHERLTIQATETRRRYFPVAGTFGGTLGRELMTLTTNA